jgi:DNA mismatch repair protein MutL
MGKDDALLCLERHATSKIRTAEDLHAIHTMGFRGEALPSIASVCRMTLTTRERDGDPAATQVIINGGKLIDVKAAGSPPGTSIEVRGLFFNVPARRKFLRSEETEYGHIYHYLTLAALAHPHVGFSFIRDGKQVWLLPPCKDLRERLRALLLYWKARRLTRNQGEPVLVRESKADRKSRTELRVDRRLSHLADERPLPGVLPVSGD